MTTEQLREKTNISYELWKSWGKDKRDVWGESVSNWEEEWKKWLFEKEGVEKNLKREKCFELAWMYGHSSGYEEVENYFRDLVEIIK